MKHLITALSIALLSLGLFYCLQFWTDRLPDAKPTPPPEKISPTQIRVEKILCDYYGADRIKRVDKMPADSVQMIIDQCMGAE